LLEVTLRIVTRSARRVGTTLAVGALALTSACGSSSSSGASGTPATSAAAAPATSGAAVAPTSGAAPTSGTAVAPTSATGGSAAAPTSAAFALPTSIKIGTDASYPPIESVDTKNGNAIVGVDPDLGAAIGKVLGIKVTFVNADFNGIVAGVASGRYDMAMSAMTDNPLREKTVDFVDYYSAGTSFMIKKGGKTVNTLADLCGLKVAVEKGTTQLDDATAQVKKCGSKPDKVLPFDKQSDANLALSSGRAEVVMADSPVNAYAALQSKGAFVIVGTVYGTAPYGIALPKKSSALRDAVAGALTKMIADGSYKAILSKWGVEAGAIDKATVNGGAAS
jgi:polar amino acid transport system substrate-binding protein